METDQNKLPLRFKIYALISILLILLGATMIGMATTFGHDSLWSPMIIVVIATSIMWLISTIDLVVQKKRKWLRILNIISVLMPVLALLFALLWEFISRKFGLLKPIHYEYFNENYIWDDIMNISFVVLLLIIPFTIWIISIISIFVPKQSKTSKSKFSWKWFTFKRVAIILAIFVASLVVGSNVLVLAVASPHCYDSVTDIPHSTYGILLGTGRSADPSPYYEARVQAAIELCNAEKIDVLVISGEQDNNGYDEVSQMKNDILAVVPDAFILSDYEGIDTWTSLDSFGDVFGYRSSVTIISQEFHNQRAIFLGSILFHETPIAYNAADTTNVWWRIRNIIRECFARTKEVLMQPIGLLR